MHTNGLTYDDLRDLKSAHDLNYQTAEINELAYRAALARLGMNPTEIEAEVQHHLPIRKAFNKVTFDIG